jgi:hypothetical protein
VCMYTCIYVHVYKHRREARTHPHKTNATVRPRGLRRRGGVHRLRLPVQRARARDDRYRVLDGGAGMRMYAVVWMLDRISGLYVSPFAPLTIHPMHTQTPTKTGPHRTAPHPLLPIQPLRALPPLTPLPIHPTLC